MLRVLPFARDRACRPVAPSRPDRATSIGRWIRPVGIAVLVAAALGSGLPSAWAQNTPRPPAAAATQAAAPSPARLAALEKAQDAVLRVRVTAVDDAVSSESLGPTRIGSGVVIDRSGTVLTIGYLLLEAESVDLEINRDRVVPARVLGVDSATGFGLLQPLVPLRLEPVPLGRSAALSQDQPLLSFSGGDEGAAAYARVVAVKPFTGTWEYHIEQALYTAPVRDDHSGAGLFNLDGELVGIGSLVLRDVNPPEDPSVQPGNLFVPIDLLKPILAELRTEGRSTASRRPWLGINAAAAEGMVRVIRVNRDSPAFEAGLRPGDRIVAVDGAPVKTLEELYKTIWRDPQPDRKVELSIRRGPATQVLTVQAVDRADVLKRSRGI